MVFKKEDFKPTMTFEENPLFAPVEFRAIGQKQYVYQGSGCIRMIPQIFKSEGWRKALLAIDPGVYKMGGADSIIKVVEDAGIEYKIFSEIKPNPHAVDVEQIGLPMYRELGADVIIAVGGGSTMDSAKGIAMIGDSELTVKDCEIFGTQLDPYVGECPWPTYPIIAIPTTCGTGSEVIRNAVISEPNGHKMVLLHDAVLPKYALEDPDLLASLPAHVAADTAMDAFVQSVESYVSRFSTDFSRLCALHAVELMGPVLVPYVRFPADKEVANRISMGSMYGGFAWNGSMPCQIHGCNHPITEILHISHGATCAILLPWFVEWNGENAKEDFWRVHNAMYPNEQVAFKDFSLDAFVKKLMKLNYDLNIMDNLTMDEYVKKYKLADGVTEETIDAIIDAQYGEGNPYCSPRRTSRAQMKQALMDVAAGKYIYKPE